MVLVKPYLQKKNPSPKKEEHLPDGVRTFFRRSAGLHKRLKRNLTITQKKRKHIIMDARTHHTLFTYKVLPGLFFQDPVKLLFLLTDTENDGQGLVGLWMQVGRDLMNKGYGLVSPLGLGAAKAAIWGEHAVVVQLPEVQAPGEADFAAMISYQGRPVFLTFERLADPDADDGLDAESVLCGWNAAGEHVNYELYGPPELEYFMGLVEKLLQETRE